MIESEYILLQQPLMVGGGGNCGLFCRNDYRNFDKIDKDESLWRSLSFESHFCVQPRYLDAVNSIPG
jgi:hypothetical protein